MAKEERIKRINRMFNGTDQELRTIYKYETELVRDQLENHFSEFFTRKNRVHLCEYEKLIFPIVQEIINIDLVCVRKLKGESEIEMFFRENNIIDRIKFAYDIDSKTMEKSFNSIPNKSKRAIELLFNLTSEDLTIEEVLDILEVNYDGLNRMVKVNLRLLYLDFLKKDQPKKSQKNVFVIPKYFFVFFEEKRYTLDKVLMAIESYTDSVKDTLKKIYGENYNESKNTKVQLTLEDIKNLKTVFISPNECVTYFINESSKKIKISDFKKTLREFNLMNYYIDMGYSKKVVIEVLKELSGVNRKVVDLYFQPNYSIKPQKMLKFGQIINSGKSSFLNRILFDSTNGIQKILKSKTENFNLLYCNNTGMVLDIYRFYRNLGYERETVEKILHQVTAEAKKSINRFYDDNLVLKESYPSNKQLQKSATATLIFPKKDIAKGVLDDKVLPHYNESITEKAYEHFYVHLGIRGIPANYVNYAISLLKPTETRVLNKYYTASFHLRDDIVIDEQELDALFDRIIYLAINYNNIVGKSKKEKYETVRNIFISIGGFNETTENVINNLDEKTIEKIISSWKDNNCTTEETMLLFIQLIIKCEYFTRICNLKDFFLSFGYTNKEFLEFLHIIEKYSDDFNLTDYFDLDTFELKHEYRSSNENLEDLCHHLDYFLSLFIHFKNVQSNVVNLENIYYTILNDTNIKAKESFAKNNGLKGNVCQKCSGRNMDYYILLSGQLSHRSFNGLTELLIYRNLFNNVLERYEEKEEETEKKKKLENE